jgi:predicted transcriptional regulator YheO
VNKKVENLSVIDYDEVDDIIGELLQEQFGIVAYSFDNLDRDVEYVAGTINIVKLGEKLDSLKHRYLNNVWTEDIEVTESYRNAIYYKLDKLSGLCKNTLSGTWSETYNFNKILNEQ